MLFMGQEFGAASPFQYFTEHDPELGKLVTEGRRKEFNAFSAFADPATRERIPDPQAASTFVNSKLHVEEASTPPGSTLQALYQCLLELRHGDVVLADQSRQRMQARALTEDVLAVRRWLSDQERLLLVNFGDVAARTDEFGGGWQVLLDSGTSTQADSAGACIAARSASVLARSATA